MLLFLFQTVMKKFLSGENFTMKKAGLIFVLFFMFSLVLNVSAQIQSQEISEKEGIPVLIKHLPDWENARNRAAFITNSDDLRKTLGERPVFEQVEFIGGTEAVTAPYPEGNLLIVEYTTPQASVDTDNKVKQRLAELGQNPPIFYRRIGNYNVFLFDGTDESAANALFDQIKYQKTVRWLGQDPTLLQRAERAFIQGTSSLFITTVLIIVSGFGIAIATGILVGFIFFYMREQKRANMGKFSDAGGMTRLNLDEFTPEVAPDRLLEE